MRKLIKSITPTQLIALGFMLVILIGSFLLSLPISAKNLKWTNYLNALFTATSATCVTGLVTYDTNTHFSIFGQIVILVLIQIGGIGFMTILSTIGIYLKKKINLYERKIIMQASGSISTQGVIALVKRIGKTTLIIEGIGAILLASRFITVFGMGKGIYFSIFHSISAFCNAGFDLMGSLGNEFCSLTNFVGDWVVNLTIMGLIISGGLGFFVWSNIIDTKCCFRKMKLHTKIVLSATAFLIIVPSFLFFIFEKDNPMTIKNLPIDEKILASLFQSVTTRTAGFNTIDLSKINDSSALLTIFLMAIGGSPGSTAGGIKTTTFVVSILSIVFSTKQQSTIVIGKRQLENNIIKQASAIISLFLFSIILSSLMIIAIDNITLLDALFETTSAIATVGLSNGVDVSSLSSISKLVLIFLMYIGRIGVISIAFLFNKKGDNELLKRPVEKILIG